MARKSQRVGITIALFMAANPGHSVPECSRIKVNPALRHPCRTAAVLAEVSSAPQGRDETAALTFLSGGHDRGHINLEQHPGNGKTADDQEGVGRDRAIAVGLAPALGDV